MLKRAFLAALFLLLGTSARPASAQLFDPYLNLYSARTILASPLDERPKSAVTGTPSRKENPDHRFTIGPYFSRADTPGPGDRWRAGLAVGYAGFAGEAHPWSFAVNYANTHFSVPGADNDVGQWTLEGKWGLWTPRNRNLPVVSIVGDFAHVNGSGEGWDVILAADQRLDDRTFFTANVGYGNFDPFRGRMVDSVVTGFGLTYRVSPRFSLSAAYSPDTAVAGDDFWSLNGSYAFNRVQGLLFGGGKDESFYVQYLHRID